ncbi:MAG TPA: biosynthetic arginine decarboxylase [Longimicrobiales bacterium]
MNPTSAAERPKAIPSTAATPETWTIQDSIDLYNVEGWGIGYFGINAEGHAVVHPNREPERGIDLFELAHDLEAQGVTLPLLLRFSDILRTRIEMLSSRFRQAIREFEFDGDYTTVYPIKVNQQRHVVEEILEYGREHGVGVEVGSKPELQAALAMTERSDHIIVCNGYKDEEFMRLALMGQKLGHTVLIVLERVAEVDTLLRIADEMEVVPTAGVRIKLATPGVGRWSESAGEKSKFGLSSAQLVKVLDRLEEAGHLDFLRMVHFHLGSQIPDIRNIKQAMTEVARFYVELRNMGLSIDYVDVGGGLGVDYDGSRSTGTASVNYSIQEYANDVIYTLAEACREAEITMPHVISESGRALTAHHSLLLVNVIDVESQDPAPPEDLNDDLHQLVHELAETLRGIGSAHLREAYHDAQYAKEQAHILFNSDVLSLRERAMVESFHLAILNQIAIRATKDPEEYEDLLPEVESYLIDRYFGNFSLFQSLPDSWAIDQLFPIMPIHRLDERPTRRGTLQDVTCDSDGKIDQFVGWRTPKTSLELHTPKPGEPYLLGMFLTGAYQEILGDLHNLFGDTNAVHVRQTANGYEIGDIVHGDTTTEVLRYVQFDAQQLVTTFRRKVQAAGLPRREANEFIAHYIEGLEGYTYLEGE